MHLLRGLVSIHTILKSILMIFDKIDVILT